MACGLAGAAERAAASQLARLDVEFEILMSRFWRSAFTRHLADGAARSGRAVGRAAGIYFCGGGGGRGVVS